MHWRDVWCYLQQAPKWQQVIVAIVFFLAIPFIAKAAAYRFVLNRRDNAAEQIQQERLNDGLLNLRQTGPEKLSELAARSRMPTWLIKRAERWAERRKKYAK